VRKSIDRQKIKAKKVFISEEDIMAYSTLLQGHDIARLKKYAKKLRKDKKCYVGIDFSLNGTGISIYDQGKIYTYSIDCTKDGVASTAGKNAITFSNPLDRFLYIYKECLTILKKKDIEAIFCEGYAFGAKGRVFDIAEGCGILLALLYLNFKCCIYKLPPQMVKKEVTGTGGAKKEHVAVAMQKITTIRKYTSFDKYDALAMLIVGYALQEEGDFSKMTLWGSKYGQ
jgi:Holliday junction resolvasome RuvABC endonuclease subunit